MMPVIAIILVVLMMSKRTASSPAGNFLSAPKPLAPPKPFPPPKPLAPPKGGGGGGGPSGGGSGGSGGKASDPLSALFAAFDPRQWTSSGTSIHNADLTSSEQSFWDNMTTVNDANSFLGSFDPNNSTLLGQVSDPNSTIDSLNWGDPLSGVTYDGGAGTGIDQSGFAYNSNVGGSDPNSTLDVLSMGDPLAGVTGPSDYSYDPSFDTSSYDAGDY